MQIWKKIRPILKSVYHFWLFGLFRQAVKLLTFNYLKYPFRKKEYARLKEFKGIHEGKRCFIVATAPSLTLEDVELIKDEITFSMNTSYKLFDKTSWRPTYYCIEDKYVYNRIKDDLNSSAFNIIFIADYINWKARNIYHVPVLQNWASTHQQRVHLPQRFQEKKFSNDITEICYFGTSVVHFIMQICFYMGFEEIYLLGADCDFSSKQNHSSLAQYKGGEVIPNPPGDIFEGLMGDYELAKKEAAKRGIKIFNATRGGKLEKFQRVNLNDIF